MNFIVLSVSITSLKCTRADAFVFMEKLVTWPRLTNFSSLLLPFTGESRTQCDGTVLTNGCAEVAKMSTAYFIFINVKLARGSTDPLPETLNSFTDPEIYGPNNRNKTVYTGGNTLLAALNQQTPTLTMHTHTQRDTHTQTEE